ncbi:hypothetical protein LX83_004311 [Goodfellowiella coeruleoviolacea]|uniref:Ricin B lectin domain-containing protein n=1 Tax=Goodfellowiella coeruleoviolacea TaxID=334858 RepID=A0AAE3KMC7_9PSEU|nr:hypothetical protein [Goodfellowiella coeruleoviolacea]
MVVDQDDGDDVYEIQNVKRGKVMEVVGAQMTDGVMVVQRASVGAHHQQWNLIRVNPGAAAPRVYRR